MYQTGPTLPDGQNFGTYKLETDILDTLLFKASNLQGNAMGRIAGWGHISDFRGKVLKGKLEVTELHLLILGLAKNAMPQACYKNKFSPVLKFNIFLKGSQETHMQMDSLNFQYQIFTYKASYVSQ